MKAATLTYLQQHNLQKILESILNKVVKEKPRDPFTFLSNEFALLALPPIPQLVFVIGPPLSGKTSHCSSLAQELGWIHLSPESLLQHERRQGTELSRTVEEYQRTGKTIPIELQLQLLRNSIDSHLSHGSTQFILDGIPRSTANFEIWKRVMSSEHEILFTLQLDASIDTLESRSSSMNRHDQMNQLEIRKRYQSWLTEQSNFIESGTPSVRTIDTSNSFEQVYGQIKQLFLPFTRSTPSPNNYSSSASSTSPLTITTNGTSNTTTPSPISIPLSHGTSISHPSSPPTATGTQYQPHSTIHSHQLLQTNSHYSTTSSTSLSTSASSPPLNYTQHQSTNHLRKSAHPR